MYTAEEGGGSLIVSGCNGAVLLELLEEIFDQMPPFIHFFVVFALLCTVLFGRDDGLNFVFFE